MWHRQVIATLEGSGIFSEVRVVGGKVRATIDVNRFLDIHYDPTSGSYSYACIDLRLPHAGDKRLFGWDDYPHEGIVELQELASYPHHFQFRREQGWIFEDSPMSGDVAVEMRIVVERVRAFLAEGKAEA